MIVFLAALLPAVVLMLYIIWRDRKRPEPTSQLLKGFGYGIASVFVSLSVTMPAMELGFIPDTSTTPLQALYEAFGGAAIPEESAKLFMLWLLLKKNPYFDEYFDGVVYAVSVGLGFAAFENVTYLFGADDGEWMSLAIVRGLLSVPAHYFFAVLMGYYYSLVHFGHNSWHNRMMVWVAPVVAHGIFDALLMVGAVEEVSGLVQSILFIGLLGFSVQLRKLCQRHIETLLQNDDNYSRYEGHYREP